MLRDRSLIPLSRQHHDGLALCVLTMRSLRADSSPANLAKTARRVIDRFELELAGHFELEEQVLFPECGTLPIIEELIREHRRMEEMVRGLKADPSRAVMEEFCELLTAHIRREERDLFEKVQQTLPRETLDRMGEVFEARAVRMCL